MEASKRLFRSESDRMVAGVAGGLGTFLGVDSTVVRLVFVLLSFLGGSGVLGYLIMWILVPSESKVGAPPAGVPRENFGEVQDVLQRGARGARQTFARLRATDRGRPDAEQPPQPPRDESPRPPGEHEQPPPQS